MTATELFDAGRLADATAAQTVKVKARPADNPARFFLFELVLFAGDLGRAAKQLDVLRYDDPGHQAAVEQYKGALAAEAKRRAVFAGTGQPKGLVAAPDHFAPRLEAVALLAAGDHAGAAAKLDEANALVPALTGTLNGAPFAGLYDADPRFGTVLEVFAVGGVYSWVPLESVESITLNPPAAPRDIVFRPAHLTLKDGLEGDVLLPGLYPGSHAHADELVRLGRATEWGPGGAGAGGRRFFAGDDTTSLADWLSVQF